MAPVLHTAVSLAMSRTMYHAFCVTEHVPYVRTFIFMPHTLLALTDISVVLKLPKFGHGSYIRRNRCAKKLWICAIISNSNVTICDTPWSNWLAADSTNLPIRR